MSELIVLKIIPNKVIAVSLLKCYDLVRRPNYCQNQKEKLDSRHCNDIWNVGSRAFGATLAVCSMKNFARRFPMPGIEPEPWQ